MKRGAILAAPPALAGLLIVLTAGVRSMGLTDVGVVALVTLTTAVMASLLVRYFDWRGRAMRRIRAEHDVAKDLDKAA